MTPEERARQRALEASNSALANFMAGPQPAPPPGPRLFSRDGQERRAWLDQKAGAVDEALRYYLGPTGIPQRLGLVVPDPIGSLTDSMSSSQEAFAPGRTTGQRVTSLADMVSGLGFAGLEAAGMGLGTRAAAGLADEAAPVLRAVAAPPPAALPAPERPLLLPAPAAVAPPRPPKPPKAPARTPVTSQDLRGPNDLFYSPSLLAAHNLPQPRGTVEQMRAMLTRGGAKEEELLWSGFDNEFSARTDPVTRDELVAFLQKNTRDPYTVRSQQASGVTGADSSMSDSDLIDQYVQDNLSDEAHYYRTERLPEQLRDEHRQVSDLDEDELIEAAESVRMGDDLSGFLRKYGDYWITDADDVTNFEREDRAIEMIFGDPEDLARDDLYERARYGDLDLDELRSDYGGGEGFDPGDTDYGEYFPGGVDAYSENIAVLNEDRVRAVSGRPEGMDMNTPSHFSGVDGLTPFWTRSGLAPSEGGTTRYVGEIQSDWAQRGQGAHNPNRTMTVADERNLARLVAERERLRETETAAYDSLAQRTPYSSTQDFLLSAPESPSSPTRRFDMGARVPENEYHARVLEHRAEPGRFAERFLQERFGRVTPEAMERLRETQGVDSALDAELGRQYTAESKAWSPRRVRGAELTDPQNLPSISEEWVRQNQALPEDGLPGFEQDPRYVANTDWSREFGNIRGALDAVQAQVGDEANRYSAGPYVRKTESWVTQGLRNELAEAILGGDRSLTVNSGNDDLVEAVSGGNTNPKPFYENTLPSIFEKMVKGYGGQVEQIPVSLNDKRYFVPGVRLTPEFVAEVRRKGIPFFMVPGGMMLGAETMAPQDQQQGREF